LCNSKISRHKIDHEHINHLDIEEVISMESIIAVLIVGLIAGWLAGLIMKGRGFGVIGNIIVGIIGAILGSLIFGALGVGTASLIGDIIMATIGAVVLLFLISLIKRA
jgi:uncharacterized membrane protein YeaQ/YmgE (transglycosylase-associated protein family)